MFSTYSINGVAQGLGLTASKSSYIGNFNTRCKSSADGSIDLSVSNGTPPYSFLWSNSATTEDLTGLTAGTYSVVVTDSLGIVDSLSVTLIEPNLLTANLTTTLHHGYAVPCNGGTASISLTPNGGAPSYTYSWSNSDSSQNLEGVGAGNYTVTVTDANGCSVSGNITLAQPSAITTSLSSPTNSFGFNISCDSTNGEIDLNVSGGVSGFRYNWNNGKLTQNIYNLDVGSYSVTVKDSNDCAVTDTITITAPPKLAGVNDSVVKYSNNKNMSCYGCHDGIIVAQPIGGTTPYSYLWSTGATTQTVTGLYPSIDALTTYSFIVTDAGGCIKTLSDISLSNAPPPPAMQLTATKSNFNGFNISCHGNSDGSIDLSVVDGTPPYTYMWSNAATTQDISGLSGGTYQVNVTDSFGFKDSLKIYLLEPNILTSTLTPVLHSVYAISCYGGNDGKVSAKGSGGAAVAATINPYTYLWSDSSTSATLEGVIAGTYHVTISDINNCTVTDSIILTQPNAITDSISSPVNSLGFNTTCNGKDGSINLSVNGGVPTATFGYFYYWNNGSISQNPSNLYPGSYSVTIKDNVGCFKIDTITLNTPPQITSLSDSINIYSDNANVSCDTCTDGVITALPVGGTSPYTYSWSNSQTTQTITGCLPLPKTYSVEVTDAAGCKKSIERIMLAPPKSNDWKATGNYESNGILGTLDSSELKIVTNSSERMRVAANGNVGIGTINPTERLEINGNVKIHGALTVDSMANTIMNFDTIRTSRIMALAGDSLIHFGDSSTILIPNWCKLWNDGTNGFAKGITLGSGYNGPSTPQNPYPTGSIAIGMYSTAIGYNVRAGYNAIHNHHAGNNVIIGNSGDPYSYFDNDVSNSLMVGFNSNIPTLSISPSHGNGTTGAVGIGVVTMDDLAAVQSSGYLLAVKGKVIAEEFRVKLYSVGWPDYVFDANYKLRSLKELSEYLLLNKHLPGIPSSGEVKTDGFALGEMQSRLLKQLEELTLYIIQQDEKIQKMQNAINELQLLKK